MRAKRPTRDASPLRCGHIHVWPLTCENLTRGAMAACGLERLDEHTLQMRSSVLSHARPRSIRLENLAARSVKINQHRASLGASPRSIAKPLSQNRSYRYGLVPRLRSWRRYAALLRQLGARGQAFNSNFSGQKSCHCNSPRSPLSTMDEGMGLKNRIGKAFETTQSFSNIVT